MLKKLLATAISAGLLSIGIAAYATTNENNTTDQNVASSTTTTVKKNSTMRGKKMPKTQVTKAAPETTTNANTNDASTGVATQETDIEEDTAKSSS